jgi:hypothetical protein
MKNDWIIIRDFYRGYCEKYFSFLLGCGRRAGGCDVIYHKYIRKNKNDILPHFKWGFPIPNSTNGITPHCSDFHHPSKVGS